MLLALPLPLRLLRWHADCADAQSLLMIDALAIELAKRYHSMHRPFNHIFVLGVLHTHTANNNNHKTSNSNKDRLYYAPKAAALKSLLIQTTELRAANGYH